MKQTTRQFFFAFAFSAAIQTVCAQVHFTATLDGAQEVPSVVTLASATGSFQLNENFSELRFFVSYQGMIASEGGLYAGGAGTIGALVCNVASPNLNSGTFSGIWRSSDRVPLTAALVESLLTGKMYIELRSPNGVGIRSPLLLSTSLHFEASYDGMKDIPAVATTGGGTGVFVLDKSRSRLDYWITYRGLSGPLASGGTINVGAEGAIGPVVRTISSSGDSPSASIRGSWTSTDSQPLTEALVDSLIAGRIYTQFATEAYPAGEVRSQIVLRPGIGFVAALDSEQEISSSRSDGSATGSFLLDETGLRVTFTLTYIGFPNGLSSGAEIHLGRPGYTGVTVKTLPQDGTNKEGTLTGTWTGLDLTEQFTSALAESLIAGKVYTELLSGPAGANRIRGQINLTTGIGFTSQLSAKEDTPPTILSNGTGTASGVLSPDRQSISYSLTYLNLSGGITAAGGHIHAAARGRQGILVKTIVPPNSPNALTVYGEWKSADSVPEPLTPAIVDSFIAGHTYINLHTNDYIGGEIRGQFVPDFDVLTSIDTPRPHNNDGFLLLQNYPNPFNPLTIIRYTLPRRSLIQLTVFNTLGQKVVDLVHGESDAGNHQVTFDARRLASGIYYYRLFVLSETIPNLGSTGGELGNGIIFVATRKLIFIK